MFCHFFFSCIIQENDELIHSQLKCLHSAEYCRFPEVSLPGGTALSERISVTASVETALTFCMFADVLKAAVLFIQNCAQIPPVSNYS